MILYIYTGGLAVADWTIVQSRENAAYIVVQFIYFIFIKFSFKYNKQTTMLRTLNV